MMEKRSGSSFYISSGYKSRTLDESKYKNGEIYGNDWSPNGVGANFLVELSWLSHEVVNGDWKVWLQDWDHKFFNEQPIFSSGPITLELIALRLFADMVEKSQLKSLELKLYLGDTQYAKVSYKNFPEVSWSLGVKFNSLHRHHNVELSDQENLELYRKCSQIHGHEYCFTIEVSGNLDKDTGVIISHSKIEKILQEEVVNTFHGSFINEKVGNTSGETFLLYLKKQISAKIPSSLHRKYFLKENRRNSFTVNS